MMSDELYEKVNQYTKYKLVEMLIEKHKDTTLDNLNIIVHCTATNISTNGNNIEKIEAVTSNYEKVTVKSKFYVLAMGGIENARFLLLNIDNIPFKNIK